jgi:hypothetical protein
MARARVELGRAGPACSGAKRLRKTSMVPTREPISRLLVAQVQLEKPRLHGLQHVGGFLDDLRVHAPPDGHGAEDGTVLPDHHLGPLFARCGSARVDEGGHRYLPLGTPLIEVFEEFRHVSHDTPRGRRREPAAGPCRRGSRPAGLGRHQLARSGEAGLWAAAGWSTREGRPPCRASAARGRRCRGWVEPDRARRARCATARCRAARGSPVSQR